VTTNTWHLRWSTIGREYDPVIWAGALIFDISDSQYVSTFLFEINKFYSDIVYKTYDSQMVNPGAFSWNISTGSIAGIDFTLDDSMTLTELSLDSSLYADLDIRTLFPVITAPTRQYAECKPARVYCLRRVIAFLERAYSCT